MTAHSQNPQEIPAQHADPEAQVEKMFEYGYRKSNYGPDELVTDAHGNPISVTDAMMTAREAAETPTTTPHLCYYSPRIPGNTGSAIRLCAVTGTILHLVEPLGFNLRDTKLRRAGLDYHDMAHVVLHPNFEDLVESMPNSRIIAFTAHATKLYTEVEYKPTDILLFGPEPGNIPDPMDIMAGPHVAEQVRLPMRPSLRSLNLTNCASMPSTKHGASSVSTAASDHAARANPDLRLGLQNETCTANMNAGTVFEYHARVCAS